MGKFFYELGKHEEVLKHLEAGKQFAQYSVKKGTLNEDDKRITVGSTQTEFIEEADNYILKAKDKIKVVK